MASAKANRSDRPAVPHMFEDDNVWRRADFKGGRREAGPTYANHSAARMRLLVKDLRCHHMLNGRVSYKLCAHGFNCFKCPYDQMIEDFDAMPVPVPVPRAARAV
jgi:hypothetical protein